MQELNSRKIITIVVAIMIVFFVVAFITFLSSAGQTGGGENNATDDEAMLTIWGVGIHTRVWDELNTGFNEWLGKDVEVRSRNFASFEDYIDILPRVIEDGNSPDIFVVPSNGGFTTMSQYIQHLDEDMIDFKEFEKQFHAQFFDQLVFEEKRQVNGTQQLVRGLQGIPIGFETLGIFYNNNMLKGIPLTWDEISELLRGPYANDEDISMIAFGKGKAVTSTADILAMHLSQRGEESIGYQKLSSIPSRSVIDTYLEYRRDPNGLDKFDEDFRQSLTATDMFAREKVAAIIGYPSTYRDVLLAIKRANKDDVRTSRFEKFLRWGYLPQVEIPDEDEDAINISRYYYMSLSRTAQHPRNALSFLRYLTTYEAQDIVFQHLEYYLPARQDLLLEHRKSTIDDKQGIDSGKMIVSDFYTEKYRFIDYDMGIPSQFRYIVEKALDEPGVVAEVIAANTVAYLQCKVRQITEGDNYDQGCECVFDVQQNNNNYWPRCEG